MSEETTVHWSCGMCGHEWDAPVPTGLKLDCPGCHTIWLLDEELTKNLVRKEPAQVQ